MADFVTVPDAILILIFAISCDFQSTKLNLSHVEKDSFLGINSWNNDRHLSFADIIMTKSLQCFNSYYLGIKVNLWHQKYEKQCSTLHYPLFSFFSAQLFAQTPIKDTVSMGPGYANAVYYNLRTGAKSQSAISTWHMSHTTVSRDNCIRLNHLNGVDVYAYPKGSNKDFSTMDTAGWSSWKHLYNDIHTHELGALNQSTNAKNPMDFSWGIYNSTTHEIEGDSLYLFVINTPSFGKSYLKFMPILQTATGDLIFRFARLNGSIDKTDTLLQSSFTGKSYKYYNFTKGAVQPEPIRENWDILFIRYMAPTTPPDGGPKVMYPTMGVESKRGERVSKSQTTLGM